MRYHFRKARIKNPAHCSTATESLTFKIPEYHADHECSIIDDTVDSLFGMSCWAK